MACPLFCPGEPFSAREWRPRPTLPLGDPHEGLCRAGAEPFRPAPDELRLFCNLGYARERCPHFPQGQQADAVRFVVVKHEEASVAVAYVIERDYRPHEQGILEYDLATEAFRTAEFSGNLESQARAYIESYLRSL